MLPETSHVISVTLNDQGTANEQQVSGHPRDPRMRLKSSVREALSLLALPE